MERSHPRRHRLARWLFHRVTVKDYVWTPEAGQRSAQADLESTRRYLQRFDPPVDVAGRTALDVGCGSGQLCFELARRGARRVVGVDLGGLDRARDSLRDQPPEVRSRVEFVETDGSLLEVRNERFDRVFSKDSFEHFADPAAVVEAMVGALVPGGELIIGFGPLWKAPTGGHIDFMTRLPWAHLLFPERVIMAERRRFRPHEDAQRFEEITGGLNKMTLARFQEIMSRAGVRQKYFATNVSDHPLIRAMKLPRALPPLREYLTMNVYSIWVKEKDA